MEHRQMQLETELEGQELEERNDLVPIWKSQGCRSVGDPSEIKDFFTPKPGCSFADGFGVLVQMYTSVLEVPRRPMEMNWKENCTNKPSLHTRVREPSAHNWYQSH